MRITRARLTSQRFDILWLSVATAIITLVMFLSGLWGSDGHLAAPLDDTFIHFQYAQQLAAGHPFEYNTGDAPSSGDSSFIYPFMLAPSYLVGLDGMKTLFYADVLNFIAHLMIVLLMYKLGFRLGGRTLGLFGASFLLLDGSLNWVFLSGMETGIYSAGLVAFFWLWLRDIPAGRLHWLAAVGALVALVRPEGHILVSLACLLTIIYLWRKRRLAWGYVWLLVPIVAGLIPYIANVVMTGSWQFNTASAKSIWYVPYSPLREKLSITVGYAITALKQTYLGLEVGRSPFPLLAAPLVVLGIFAALRQKIALFTNRTRKTRLRNLTKHARTGHDKLRPYMRPNRRGVIYRALADQRFFHTLMVLTLLGGIGLALLLPPLHFNRYYMPYNAFVWLYLSIGLLALVKPAVALTHHASRFTRRVPQSKPNSALRTPHSAFAIVVLLCLPQFVAYFFVLGDSTRDIYYQQMTFSEWVRRYTPADARIAVNDIGAHKYLSNRYVLDLIGLTSNYMRGAYFGGWGAIYDRLAALPEKERPTHLLVHPNAFGNGLDESISQSFLNPLYAIRVQNPIITAGDTEVLYRVDWGNALLDPEVTYLLRMGEKAVDTFNVGDLDDERHHAYKLMGRQSSMAEPKSVVTSAPYEESGFTLTESGRRHSGWEEFSVKSVPGKPLIIVVRTRLAPDAGQMLLVFANGREVGLWKSHNERASAWQEYEYAIPAEFITSEQTTVRIDSTFDPGGPGFSDYRYWFYAP
ncbi:MAG TPA: hypothetical protein VJ183_19055 [Chloroflexia bacterium]|nr:hypothetical protein [Chloroflexia bacterium]